MFNSYNFSNGNTNNFCGFLSLVDSYENNKNTSNLALPPPESLEVDKENFENNIIDKFNSFHADSLKENENQSAFNDELIKEIRGIRQDIKNNFTSVASDPGSVDLNKDIYNNQIVIIYLLSVLIFVILINRFWSAFRR